MAKVKTNACVVNPLDAQTVKLFREQLGAIRYNSGKTMERLSEDFNMSVPAWYRRFNDPDMFTVGQLRRLREVLGVDREVFVRLVGPLL